MTLLPSHQLFLLVPLEWRFSLVNCQVNHIERDKKLINISDHGDVFLPAKLYLQFLLHVLEITGVLSFLTPDVSNGSMFDRVLFFSEDLFYIQS